MKKLKFLDAITNIFYNFKCYDGTIIRNMCSLYQENCRIYMDEYPEGTEVDLRVNFDTSLLMKRFLNKK